MVFDYTITTDAHQVADWLGAEAASAPAKVAAITQRNGARLLQMVRTLSPVDTGEYRRSHRIELSKVGNTYMAEVYTDLPRGQMLEFGGPQEYSDGTVVHRDPSPHYRPAFYFASDRYYTELFEFMSP